MIEFWDFLNNTSDLLFRILSFFRRDLATLTLNGNGDINICSMHRLHGLKLCWLPITRIFFSRACIIMSSKKIRYFFSVFWPSKRNCWIGGNYLSIQGNMILIKGGNLIAHGKYANMIQLLWLLLLLKTLSSMSLKSDINNIARSVIDQEEEKNTRELFWTRLDLIRRI